MKKSELRTLFLKKREAFSFAELNALSKKIADVFFASVDLERVDLLHCYLPIERFREVDSSIVLHEIWEKYPRIRTVVPRINFETNSITSVAATNETLFVQNRWGVDEPAGGEIVDAMSIDLVVVPLLAFDNRGHRVGYGKGFYDRFLKACRADCLRAGMSFFPPVDLIEDVSDHDVVLDAVITPDDVFRFQATV